MEQALSLKIQMPSERAVVVPAFRPNTELRFKNKACASCHQSLQGPLQIHLCESCGTPQPLDSDEDYFTLFAIEPGFSHNPNVLRDKFYELSRALHPDRFVVLGDEARTRSMDRMCLINQAYQVLRDRHRIREYLFNKFDVKIPKSTLPFDLAEEWFDIQDQTDPARLKEFTERLKTRLSGEVLEIAKLESQFDQTLDVAVLTQMAERISRVNTLKSLEQDVRRRGQES
jgi:DnaJ-domain-containing protein 1